jgi:hypothetical protein
MLGKSRSSPIKTAASKLGLDGFPLLKTVGTLDESVPGTVRSEGVIEPIL